jgi:hypothetical protein
MLESGSKDCDPNIWCVCPSSTPWVIATTVERNIFQSFQNITPLVRSSGGNHAFNFVETFHREGCGGIGPGTVTASAQSFSRFETDQVFIALGELADAAKDLQRNAEEQSENAPWYIGALIEASKDAIIAVLPNEPAVSEPGRVSYSGWNEIGSTRSCRLEPRLPNKGV